MVVSVIQRGRLEDEKAMSGETGERQPLEMTDVTMQGGTVELGEHDLRVSGDVYQGGVIRGVGGVSVQGHVSGSLAHRCVIEVGGDVVVRGDVQGARIRCRSLKVAGSLDQAEVLSDRGLEVGGSMTGVEAQVGMWGHEYRQIVGLLREVSHLKADLNGIDGRVGLASRRFLRDYGHIDVRFGNVITKSRRGIEVDLKDVYRILHDRSEEEVDRGLQEFFFKAIVGVLTRMNRTYVSQNPSRQSIFLKLVSDLRGHIMEVREKDKLQARIQSIEDRRQRLIDTLKAPTPWGVAVRGQIGPETTIRLMQFRSSTHEGEVSAELERRTAQLRVASSEAGDLALNLVSLDGVSSPKMTVSQAEISSVRISLKDGFPAWEGIPTVYEMDGFRGRTP